MPPLDQASLEGFLALESIARNNEKLRKAQDLLFLIGGQRPRLAFTGVNRNRQPFNFTRMSSVIESDGRFFVVPTVFRGNQLDPDSAFEMAARIGFRDPQTFEPLPAFDTLEEAERHARGLSKNAVRRR